MDWKLGPPVLVGQKVLWSGSTYSPPVKGTIKWIGNIPEISSDWCVGVEMDVALPSIGGDGFWKDRKLFECRSKHGLLVPMEEIQKFSSKIPSRPASIENYSNFKLEDSQLTDFKHSHLRYDPWKEIENTEIKNRYSNSESKVVENFFNRQTPDSCFDSNKENQKNSRGVPGGRNISRQTLQLKNQDVIISPQKDTSGRRNSREIQFQRISRTSTLSSSTGRQAKETFENSQNFDSKAYINELVKNMNEIAGYFKEIKEGDEQFEKQEQTNNPALYDTVEAGHSKPKKLFSFLKWFNKKNKQDPNLKLFKESSSATSSPMFPRKETSSCESIDTLFSTQTVRSFAYIPPTQYKPSAPPLDYEKYENDCEELSSQKNAPQETESIYEKRKKRKAPEPPRLSRENSLPTTLERITNDEDDFDGIKTFHRRTVSESFKDKKAGLYCHVQGKRKAPPPPVVPLYPNLQKLNNQYPSLYKKKKPAPPPPEPNSGNQTKKDVQKEKETSQPTDGSKKEKPGDLKDNNRNEEKGMIINQTPKDRLIKDASLSPLPSRPWYKRSHRDSTGSNIIRKDLLKGFEKKKNKETDDWMPEVGFPRRSLSTESHSKFNIFSKLEKTEDKKKEEKRKSQISILTNISELDREAAEIVRKEQAEEKKMMAENDAKYYSPKEIKEKIRGSIETPSNGAEKIKISGSDGTNNVRGDEHPNRQITNKITEPQATVDHPNSKEINTGKNQSTTDEHLKAPGEILKDKGNDLNPDSRPNDNQNQNLFSPNVLADLTNSSSQFSQGKIPKPSQNSSQARLNFFSVQNKELNYLNEPWVCHKCTLENPGWRVFCEICSSIKPRFPPTNAVPQGMDALKPESTDKKIDKPSEIKDAVGEPKHTTKQRSQISENKTEKEMTPIKNLDEIRKKRMNFFSPKLDSNETDDKESESSLNNSKAKLKKIAKKITDCSSVSDEEHKKEELDEKTEESNKEYVKRKQERENNNLKRESQKENGEQKKEERKTKENASTSTDPEESRDKRKEFNGKESLETSLTSVEQKKNVDSNEEKVIEAYVVTKTIVLEDVIVKKPDRGKKVSASVQTKSSFSTTPEAKVMRPPPRTKKIVFRSPSEAASITEIESFSENVTQENAENDTEDDLEELTSKLTQAEGLADFRAKIQTMPLNTEMNTVAVNRLLRKLEAAINCGDQFVAAGLAKELALMKINCSVTRQVTTSPGTSKITIDLYIEDKVSHQGPIPLEVSPTMSLLQLKKKIHQEFGIPLEVQRWILGKKLATEDNKTLESEGVKNDYCPLFLYLVAPDKQKPDKEVLIQVAGNTDLKPTQSDEENPSPKAKGWYYNYEEDHYSFCEDSDDDLKGSNTNVSGKTKEIELQKENKIEASEPNLKTDTEPECKKLPVFDLKSSDAENDAEKELKFISVNFVKKKVEKLNKTFAENARAIKQPLRSIRSPESWKCGVCNAMNLQERSNCFSCKAKKLLSEPKNKKIYNEQVEGQSNKESPTEAATGNDNIHYKTLMELQDADFVPNSEPFSCSVCLVDYNVGEGVTLKDCLHTFCRTCLVSTVQFSEDAEVKCPYLDETYSCPSVLQQREIKALVPKGIFELHLAKSVKEAENKIENAFHCKTPDCKGWCIYEDNVNEFRCPVCKFNNCLTCQAIHNGINCKEYQERMKDASETDINAKKTRDMLNEMVEKGEAMICPKCQVVLMKKWGCDWLKCSMCKTEICWVTRGFRWGPEGKGDTSGGCKCGVNGVKCHPKCNYCH